MALLRAAVLASVFILAAACGKSSDKQVQELVAGFGGAELQKKQIEVTKFEGDGEFAMAEITVRTAVKLRKENDRWVIDEVRLGDRRWEKADRIWAALEQQRRQAALEQLDQIRQGIQRYRQQNSQVPQSEGFTALIDELAPRFLSQVIRIDPWSNPFQYRPLGTDRYDLRSAGPDRRFETQDDVYLESP